MKIQSQADRSRPSVLSVLGLASGSAAFLAAACCVLPFVFVAAGLGGTWLSFLDYGLAYRTEIQVLALLAIVSGWTVYLWRGRPPRTGIWMLSATLLLAASWLVWEFQGEIRLWLQEIRS
jgi:VIT1/CCC1 family predicted Fe2+/Mn2+ transporter